MKVEFVGILTQRRLQGNSVRESAQIVFKCPVSRIPCSGTVVHKYVISNCLITLPFFNISRLKCFLVSNE